MTTTRRASHRRTGRRRRDRRRAAGSLRLPTIRDRFGEIADAAEREQLSYRGFLAELLMAECDDRDRPPRRPPGPRAPASPAPKRSPTSTSPPTRHQPRH